MTPARSRLQGPSPSTGGDVATFAYAVNSSNLAAYTPDLEDGYRGALASALDVEPQQVSCFGFCSEIGFMERMCSLFCKTCDGGVLSRGPKNTWLAWQPPLLHRMTWQDRILSRR